MKKTTLIILLLLVSIPAMLAQTNDNNKDTDESEDPYDSKSYFMYAVNYLTDNVSNGRKDSVIIPYISPYIGYHNKNGLYAKAIAGIVAGKKRVDLFTLQGGYDHSFGDKWDVGANAEKYFYNKNSTSIRTSTKGSVSIYGQYNNDYVSPNICLYTNINDKADFGAELRLEHDFHIAGTTLNIIPAAAMNLGTQYFLDEYYVNRLTKKDKTIKVKRVVANPQHFVPLDYELSAKVTYRVKGWLFTLIPTYAIPTSPATITLPTKTLQEHLTNSFYLELEICHR